MIIYFRAFFLNIFYSTSRKLKLLIGFLDKKHLIDYNFFSHIYKSEIDELILKNGKFFN